MSLGEALAGGQGPRPDEQAALAQGSGHGRIHEDAHRLGRLVELAVGEELLTDGQEGLGRLDVARKSAAISTAIMRHPS